VGSMQLARQSSHKIFMRDLFDIRILIFTGDHPCIAAASPKL
jgi:hypothetical protein